VRREQRRSHFFGRLAAPRKPGRRCAKREGSGALTGGRARTLHPLPGPTIPRDLSRKEEKEKGRGSAKGGLSGEIKNHDESGRLGGLGSHQGRGLHENARKGRITATESPLEIGHAYETLAASLALGGGKRHSTSRSLRKRIKGLKCFPRLILTGEVGTSPYRCSVSAPRCGTEDLRRCKGS